ncbi:MAG TPA: hypothetical protein VLC06_21280 [Polyangia bacterium]|nr:hypothetical protein [Polyangia bacterium]
MEGGSSGGTGTAGAKGVGGAGIGTGGSGAAGGSGGAGGGAGTGAAAGGGGNAGAGGAAGVGGSATGGSGGASGACAAVSSGLNTIAAIAPGGASFALGTPDGRLEMRRWSDNSLLPIHYGCFGATGIAYSLDGTLFAAANSLGAQVWQVSDGALLQTIPALANAAAMSLSNDGSVVAGVLGPLLTGLGRLVILRPAGVLAIGSSPVLGGVAVSPDGTLVAALNEEASGSTFEPHAYFDSIWNVSNGQALVSLAAGRGIVDVSSPPVVFSPDGTLVAFGIGGDLGFAQVLRSIDGSLVFSTGANQPAAFSADGASLLAVSLQITNLEIYTVSDGTVASTFSFSWPFETTPQYIAAGFSTGLTTISVVEAITSASLPFHYALELFTDATQTGSVPFFCNTDSDCLGDAEGPHCFPDGSYGRCGCMTAGDCAQDADGQACVTPYNLGYTQCGCATAADCPSGKACPFPGQACQ